VKLLLEKGAEPDSEDRRGQTPLSMAAETRHEAVLKLLLEKGAELDSKGYLRIFLARRTWVARIPIGTLSGGLAPKL
jgi:ankyrin repeat protein